MRYWAYLTGKLTIAFALLYPLLRALDRLWPEGAPDSPPVADWQQALIYNFALMGWFLLACGVFALIILDQRRRCRVCLRRLTMPVGTGSWGRILLLGRPRTEYICVYGHGTLQTEELQFTGMQSPEWAPHGDYWEELCASSKASGGRP